MMSWDGIDRRRFVRVKVSFKAHIYDEERTIISTYAEELSQKGIKVSIKKELKRKTLVDLEIYVRDEPIICRGKIVWVKKIEGSYLESGFIFDIGIELQELKEEDKKYIKSFILQKRKESS
tara:strand:+ start:437 stop:799 length:363 start_codon:yes stop_codon:yes gene_type:complete